jgi:hypothetical protein
MNYRLYKQIENTFLRRIEQNQIPVKLTNIFHLLDETSGLKNREYGRAIRRTDHATPSIPKRLAVTSPTSGGRSVGIVRSRTKATELLLLLLTASVV